jgi:hypothetical protein
MWHHINAESTTLLRTWYLALLNCSGIPRFIALNKIHIAVPSTAIFVNALESFDEIDNSE